MDVDYEGKIVSTTPIYIRNGPGTSYEDVGTLSSGEIIKITKLEGEWVFHEKGWSIIRQDAITLIKMTKMENNTVKDVVQPKTNPEEKTIYSDSQYNNTTETTTLDEETAGEFIRNVRGIHGMPYQFMSSVDRRLDGSQFGRKFTEKIINRMPLLLLTPGRPKFMKSFTFKEQQDIIQYIKQRTGDDTNGMDQLLNREGRFYDIEFNYKDYYEYVNPMAQMTAKLLNLDNKLLDGIALDKYRWEKYTNNAFTNFVSSAETVAFYIDSENQITESFSNSTGESMLAGKVNSLSDMGREIQFLMGGAAGVQFDALKQENYDSTLKQFDDFSKKYLKMVPESLISKLGSGFLTVSTGGKMVFPEIWNESHFSRNYTINMKLRTPDTDLFSWYMNIAIPLLHLIALVAPQEMGPNAYKSPFLVRGYYKGFFNCAMGIITSMNITKGSEAKWTINGLPTEVDITFDIKDLYDVMSITKQSEIVHLMNNTALMDYLANMCGININKPEVLRQVDIYLNQFVNAKGLPARFTRGFNTTEQYLNNKLRDLYSIVK